MVVIFGIVLNRLNVSMIGLYPYTGVIYTPSWMEILVSVTIISLGVLLMTGAKTEPSSACIRCGRCIDQCPMRVMPASISQLVEAGSFDDTTRFGVLDCIECGVCAYVCPSKRPIVQQVKQAKGHLARKRAEAERKKAEAAQSA